MYLRVSPVKGVKRFGMKGNLAPRYIGPFPIHEKCGTVAYKLELPPLLTRVHDIFHMSQLKKCLKAHVDVVPPEVTHQLNNRLTTIGMSILLIQNLMTTMLTVRYNIIAMAGMAIGDVRYTTMTMLFINSSLKYHLLMANMILMLIFLGNWLLNKNLHALNSLILLLFGGWNMARNMLMTYQKLGLL
jgi:hypothetical protein